MVSFPSLWLPVVLSAVAVFLASSVLHMVLRYHRSDYTKVPNEDAVMDVLRSAPPGDYMMPHAPGPEAMKDPVFQEKAKRGPMAIVTITRGDMRTSFRRALQLWFVYCLVVGVFVAAVGWQTLRPGAHEHSVIHLVTLVAFLGYGMALSQASIWNGRRWSTTFKSLLDAAIYALITAAIFAWLWPK